MNVLRCAGNYRRVTGGIAIVLIAFCGGFVVPGYAAGADETSDYVHYRLGVKYRAEGKDDQALEEFRKVLATYPDNYNAYMHSAEICMKQGKYSLAVYNLKKALAYNPGWAKAYRHLAAAYENDKQYANALQALQSYHEVCDPDEKQGVQADINRITALLAGKVPSAAAPTAETAEGRPGAPQRAYAAAVQPRRTQAGPKAEIEFKHGVAAYQRAAETNDAALYEKALEHFRATLTYSPDHAGAYYYAGLIRRRNGQNQMAKVNFLKALSYPELGYNAHFYLGKIYGDEKNYENAIEHLRAYIDKTSYEPGKREAQSLIDRYASAIKADRGDTVTVNVAAIAEADMHREVSEVPPEMRYAPMEVRIDSLLTMAIVDTLSDPGREMLKVVRTFTAGAFDPAIEGFKKILVKYPRGDVAARSMYNIGVCYIKLRNYQAAENQFQQVIERYPSHDVASNSVFFKAFCAFERGEAELAERLLRRFIQTYGTHAWVGKAYEKLGDAYTDLAQYRKAVDAYTQAAARSASRTDEVYAWYKLGDAYLKIDNAQRSLEAYGKAIAVGEKNGVFERVPDSYYKIADYYYSRKEYQNALKYYTQVTRKYEKYHDTPWGLFQIGNIYKNEKKYDAAVKQYDELIRNYQGDYWAGQAQWKKEDAVWENEYKSVLR